MVDLRSAVLLLHSQRTKCQPRYHWTGPALKRMDERRWEMNWGSIVLTLKLIAPVNLGWDWRTLQKPEMESCHRDDWRSVTPSKSLQEAWLLVLIICCIWLACCCWSFHLFVLAGGNLDNLPFHSRQGGKLTNWVKCSKQQVVLLILLMHFPDSFLIRVTLWS